MSTRYCRHIRTNGRRCCAIAVRGQSLCFYHRGVNARHRTLNPPPDDTPTIIHPLNLAPGNLQRNPLIAEYFSDPGGPIELDFPTLDDRESIQVALSMLLLALGRNRLDPKRASIMLYGLQVASANARNLRPTEDHVVSDTVLDEDGQEIAPDEDPEEIVERARRQAEFEAQYRDDGDQEYDEENDEDDEEAEASPQKHQGPLANALRTALIEAGFSPTPEPAAPSPA
jgi:hypothetical protein